MWLYWVFGLIVFIGILVVFYQFMLRRLAGHCKRARELFHSQKSELGQQFFEIASASGKPRGLIWKQLTWGDKLEFVRDKPTGLIGAMMAVTIQFEAVEGSEMEGMPAVKDAKNATAFFLFEGDRWVPTGRAFFNLNPDEALVHFEKQFVPLG